MQLQENQFDAVAYQVEAHLRELRHLMSETVFLSDPQNAAVHAIVEKLHDLEAQTSALRHSLLTGEDPDTFQPKPVGEPDPVQTL